MDYRKALLLHLFCLTAFFSIISCSEQTKSNTDKSQQVQYVDSKAVVNVLDEPIKTPGNVDEIQKAYSAIMEKLENGTLDSTSFKYSCNNEKSGTVSYFSEKGRLRMIVHRYNEYDHYAAVDRYFVADSAVFFVYLNGVSWSFEGGTEGATKDNITERRVYLIDQQAVRCLEKKFTVRSQATSNPRSETVPNKEVDCASLKSILKPYQLLAAYRYSAPSGCLED